VVGHSAECWYAISIKFSRFMPPLRTRENTGHRLRT
jgi:hypothetical protein